MDMQRPLSALITILFTAQILNPVTLWASEQHGMRGETSNQALITAISGEQLTVQSSAGSKTLFFRDSVDVGDQIATGDATVAEVLIGRRAVVKLRPNTTVKLTTLSPEQTSIQVTQGIVRVAASATALGEQGTMIIQMPEGQVLTRGGIVRVMVNAPVGSVEYTPVGEAKPYLTSTAPNTIVAALDTRGDIIQVKEGAAEITGMGAGDEIFKVQAGQSVTLQAGQAGSIAALLPPGDMRVEVLASADHSNTPQQGREHLVELQVDQATQLARLLTGSDDSAENSIEKDNVQNAIIGSTGGVKLVSTLFGGGSASNPSTPNPLDSTGSGFSVQKSDGTSSPALGSTTATIKVNGGENALLVFTKKNPVEPTVITEKTFLVDAADITFPADALCDRDCWDAHASAGEMANIDYRPVMQNGAPLSITSEFTVERELVLVGGTPNNFHGGIAPTERLIVRGAPGETKFSNVGIAPHITPDPFGEIFGPFPAQIIEANSAFVFRDGEISPGNSTLGFQVSPVPGQEPDKEDPLFGGILGQFANNPDGPPGTLAIGTVFGAGASGVTGAITATGSNVVLTGGVTLDRETLATINMTTATNNYFTSLGGSDAKFNGSLLSVINGPTGPTTLTAQDRLLGVYDGSMINTNGGNKALLSVLDAKLTGPAGVPLIDINAALKEDGVTQGSQPEVTVTSAVVTRSTIPLDGPLLEASAPLLALTQAIMTTTSHFADLAGNQAQSIQLNDALVALNASQLAIQNGHLLNLNNATATVNGYLFSLNNSSTLTISKGTLFSLNNGSSLNLNTNAFGVFGSGANTLSIDNDLCAAGACGTLVDSVHTPFTVDGSELHVAGVTQDVVLPDGFNVFAGNPASLVNISPDAALFEIDSNSTLTINGTDVVNP